MKNYETIVTVSWVTSMLHAAQMYGMSSDDLERAAYAGQMLAGAYKLSDEGVGHSALRTIIDVGIANGKRLGNDARRKGRRQGRRAIAAARATHVERSMS